MERDLGATKLKDGQLHSENFGALLHVLFLIQGPLHHMYKAFDAYTQPTKGTTQALVDSVVGTPPLSALLFVLLRSKLESLSRCPKGPFLILMFPFNSREGGRITTHHAKSLSRD